MAQKELEKEKHEQEEKAMDQAYQMRSLEETHFLQEVESLNKIIAERSEKENPMVSVVIETEKDLKKQFDVCKDMQNNYRVCPKENARRLI